MSPTRCRPFKPLVFLTAFFSSYSVLVESHQTTLSKAEHTKNRQGLEMIHWNIPQDLAHRATVYTINNQNVVLTDQDTGSQLVSRWMINLINQNAEKEQPTTFGLATGSAPVLVYKYLADAYEAGQFTTDMLSTINLDEYIGLPENAPESYREFMRHHLITRLGLPDQRFHIFSTAPVSYIQTERGPEDQEIERFGAVVRENPRHIQLLGIGTNGHIAFNEPSDGLTENTSSHIVELAESTRISNAVNFQGDTNKVPTHARTLGMKEILEAERIVILAWGSKKAAVVADGILRPVTSQLPASFLQTHPNVVWVADQEAASLLLEKMAKL